MMFKLKSRSLDLSSPVVMGILNVTPDSFSDGGLFLDPGKAVRQAEKMVAEGALIIDVGGESTRPGAQRVSEYEELERVCPVVEALKARVDVAVSVDTSQWRVAQECIALGVDLVNDVRALTCAGMVDLVVRHDMPVCLMHMQGQPQNMQEKPVYNSVINEVVGFLQDRSALLVAAGLDPARIMIDPGFGFGKRLDDNLQLLAGLSYLQALGFPVLVGLSRKSMIGAITGKPVADRLAGSVVLAAIAVMNGASVVRAHDVSATVDAIRIASELRKLDARHG
jgi:dihydropteroate synthase